MRAEFFFFFNNCPTYRYTKSQDILRAIEYKYSSTSDVTIHNNLTSRLSHENTNDERAVIPVTKVTHNNGNS